LIGPKLTFFGGRIIFSEKNKLKNGEDLFIIEHTFLFRKQVQKMIKAFIFIFFENVLFWPEFRQLCRFLDEKYHLLPVYM